MHDFRFFIEKRKPKILCLGAHPDDIEIGCGGTVLKIISDLPEAQFYWVVFSGDDNRAKEAKQSANVFLKGVESKTIIVNDFKESYFPFFGVNIKDFFEKLKQKFSPDLVFTHCGNDAHQDHRLLSHLTWNTFRNNFILEYEIHKYDGDLGNPNLYSYLNEAFVQKKVKTICKVFQSQNRKPWFSEDTFKSILRIRGVESNSPNGYAEAFYCRKIVFR
ncbi:MAG: PIG-L family deacetylase [Candidatus Bathyarchaeota archaeon]|nr:MAG: PIG-L family deacetylase [Candidatus Bathyarchaeota archaeon]